MGVRKDKMFLEKAFIFATALCGSDPIPPNQTHQELWADGAVRIKAVGDRWATMTWTAEGLPDYEERRPWIMDPIGADSRCVRHRYIKDLQALQC